MGGKCPWENKGALKTERNYILSVVHIKRSVLTDGWVEDILYLKEEGCLSPKCSIIWELSFTQDLLCRLLPLNPPRGVRDKSTCSSILCICNLHNCSSTEHSHNYGSCIVSRSRHLLSCLFMRSSSTGVIFPSCFLVGISLKIGHLECFWFTPWSLWRLTCKYLQS